MRSFCTALQPLGTDLARALVIDGGPQSDLAGARLIAAQDGGCKAVR